MSKLKDDILFFEFMKQDKSFSEFYESFKEEDTGDSTSFMGKTPQTTIDPEDIEEEDEDEDVDDVDIKAPSIDYQSDNKSIKLGRNIG